MRRLAPLLLMLSLLACDAAPTPAPAPQLTMLGVFSPSEDAPGVLEAPIGLFEGGGALVPVTLSLCRDGASCLAGRCEPMGGLLGALEGASVVSVRGGPADRVEPSRVRWAPGCDAPIDLEAPLQLCARPAGGAALASPVFTLASSGVEESGACPNP